jgi:tetratricopeptide (TPR) repeat protein
MEKIALDELNAGNARAAVEQLRAVVELDRRLHPADHPSIGLTQIQLANALRESGDTNAAAREADDAIAQLGKTIAKDDVRMWGPWYAAGKAALAAEHFARARECLQHARDLGSAAALTPWDWSELDFLFARALAEGDRTNAAARALASSARARLRPSDPTDAALLREIDGWLGDG